jgi:hypothetical protein
MSVVGKMNKTKYSALKTLFIMVVVVVAAIALLQAGSPKMTDAQPILPPSAEVKPQPKTISPGEQTTQFKNVLLCRLWNRI